jgi:hypothetical protein
MGPRDFFENLLSLINFFFQHQEAAADHKESQNQPPAIDC